jgi:hypothetical protein
MRLKKIGEPAVTRTRRFHERDARLLPQLFSERRFRT